MQKRLELAILLIQIKKPKIPMVSLRELVQNRLWKNTGT